MTKFEYKNFSRNKDADFSDRHAQVDVYANGTKICTYHWNPFADEDFKWAKEFKVKLTLKLGELPMDKYLKIWQGNCWGKKLVEHVDDIISNEVWAYYERHLIEPKTDDVMYCLYSDITGYEECRDFEDFANNFGYDSDSRKAEAIYKAIESEILACVRAGIKEEIMEWGDTHPDY